MIEKISVDSKRTYIMSQVKQKDTGIEVSLRSRLHKLGFRFRKNSRKLPGSPDIVLPKYKTAIFVHGCFWHGHDNCIKGKRPKTRSEYWLPKIDDNKRRDLKKIDELAKMKWRVAIVWQCSLDDIQKTENTISELANWIVNDNPGMEIIEF
jgi:DNA mismatch endonuclease (patch repair protein)